MFGLIGWWVAFPLALAAEAVGVIACLNHFVDGDPAIGQLLATIGLALTALAAFFVGYALRDAR